MANKKRRLTGLGRVLDAGGGEAERVDGPGEVGVPVDLAEGETLADSWLIDLDGEDAGLLEVDDLVAESERELLGLGLASDVDTGEGPVEDSDGSWREGKGTSATATTRRSKPERATHQ